MSTPIDQYRRLAADALENAIDFAYESADGICSHKGKCTIIDRDQALAALTAAAVELVEQIIGEDADYRMHPDAKYLTGHPVEDKHLVDYILAETRGANGLRAKQRAALQSQRKQVEGDTDA